LCLPRSLPHLSPRRRSQRGARAAQRARTTLTPTSGDPSSATRKAPAAHPRSADPVQTPWKPSRNGYNPPTRRSNPKPIPQKENPSSNPSGHPHSCRKTPNSDAGCHVYVGGMTLAVPGAKGFVALAQRAVIRSGGSCRLSDVPIAKPWGSSRGQVVVGETCTERFHVCPARSIHRDTGVKRRERPSHILGSGTLGEVAVILGQATSASARFSPREAREPGHARATRPGR
jgi:hypothetical protein